MAIDPMHQFQVTKVIDLPPVFGLDLSITNVTLSMLIAAGLVIALFAAVSAGLSSSMIGDEGVKFFPFVFTIFSFILAMNMLGMFIFFHTATSQLAVTATLALLTIGTVIIVGFARNGLGFFKLFVPSGVPIFILPFLVIIEVISFLVRPVTLALRLFGNMIGGHVVLKIFAGFVISLGAMAAAGGLGFLGIPGAAVALGSVVALTALEFIVAFLQAFVFAALTCVYLNDVVNLHHH
jgi:F-type H+-transporting ATPase subunit a